MSTVRRVDPSFAMVTRRFSAGMHLSAPIHPSCHVRPEAAAIITHLWHEK